MDGKWLMVDKCLLSQIICDLQQCWRGLALLRWTGCLLLLPGCFPQAAHRARRCQGRSHAPLTWDKHITDETRGVLHWAESDKLGCDTEDFTCLPHTHQSMACSIPWFPVLATAFSLKTSTQHHMWRFISLESSLISWNLITQDLLLTFVTHALFLSKPISSRLSSVVSSAILTWNRLYTCW